MMIRRVCLGIAVTALAAAAPAHDAHHAHHGGAAPAAAGIKVVLSDAPLLDASGRPVHLARDVIDGRIAVVNFIYTHCTTVCPVTSATFEVLQRKLGDALGRDVVLVSITVDPLRDTPKRLHEFAQRYDAGPSWMWLTGKKPAVDQVLDGFGAYTPDFEDHPAMVVVGDARTGAWTRLFGFPPVEQILSRVESLRAARTAARSHPMQHEQASR